MTTQTLTQNALQAVQGLYAPQITWQGPVDAVVLSEDAVRAALLDLDAPLAVVQTPSGAGVAPITALSTDPGGLKVLGLLPPAPLESLGDPAFRACYGLRAAYSTGAMAHGIASEAMIVALGKAGLLGSFGAAGMLPAKLEEAIRRIQAALPNGPYAINLIHSPHEEAMERGAVELFLRYGVRVVEASAFLDLTPSIVEYRAAGLSQGPDGQVVSANHVIAKLSRREVAAKFMSPAPEALLNALVQEGRITPQQAELARRVPMADDVTVEADSGGHTDNRPLVCLLPAVTALRDELQAKFNYPTPVRVGAAGGISTPAAALAAFAMGAAYVVTGSINQACVEAGASAHTRKLLAQAGMADVVMAPSADMFEMGVKVQVLKTGTLFAMRAQKLYDLYTRCDSLEAIPAEEREKLERQVFKRSLDSVWEETVRFFGERDPEQIERARQNPKRKMALVFRWYLGLASRWSNSGEAGREMDYQIWCGPAIGPFNDWTRGTYLAAPENRHVVDVALHVLAGCAYLSRVQALKAMGVVPAPGLAAYRCEAPLG
jgi:PfaD family protein